MSSLFESEVRRRREHTPWATVNLQRFMRDAALEAGYQRLDDQEVLPVTLTCRYRRDVSTSLWWSLEWIGADGQPHVVTAQTLELCLWRAAEGEMQARARAEREDIPYLLASLDTRRAERDEFRRLAHHAQDLLATSSEMVRQLTADLEASRAREAALREVLESSRIPHLTVDGDNYYSCELRGGEYTPEDIAVCSCGADLHNARIDAVLAGRAAAREDA